MASIVDKKLYYLLSIYPKPFQLLMCVFARTHSWHFEDRNTDLLQAQLDKVEAASLLPSLPSSRGTGTPSTWTWPP